MCVSTEKEKEDRENKIKANKIKFFKNYVA